MNLPISKLEELVLNALRKTYSDEYARRIADVILFGELSGKVTHGLVRLLSGDSVLMQRPTGSSEIIHKTKLSSLIEGNGNPGMLVGSIASDEVIRIAKEHDIGIVGTRGTFSTSGCLSYYLEKIARVDLIAVIMAQSPMSSPPYGGIEPLFGTNPVGFGIPAFPRPVIFDMGTSAISFGELLNAQSKGISLPEGVALDRNGNPTTDPNQAMDGAILSFDKSYKGSGLSMMVEILAGALPNASNAGNNMENGWGNIFIAFSAGLLSDVDDFKKRVEILIETVRNSKTKSGEPVRIVGEKTLETRDAHVASGLIEVDEHIYDLLLAAQ